MQKVEQLTKVVLSHWEEKGLIVKDPSTFAPLRLHLYDLRLINYRAIFTYKRCVGLGRWRENGGENQRFAYYTSWSGFNSE